MRNVQHALKNEENKLEQIDINWFHSHLQAKRYVHGYAARKHGAHGHEASIVSHRQRGEALVNGHRHTQLATRTVPLLEVATLLSHLAQWIGNGEKPVVILVRLDSAVATALKQVLGTLGRLPLQLVVQLARAQIPHQALCILRNAYNVFAVGTEVQVIDFLVVCRQLAGQLHLWKRPDAQLSICATCGHQTSIATDPHHTLQRLGAAEEIRLYHIGCLNVELQSLELLEYILCRRGSVVVPAAVVSIG